MACPLLLQLANSERNGEGLGSSTYVLVTANKQTNNSNQTNVIKTQTIV